MINNINHISSENWSSLVFDILLWQFNLRVWKFKQDMRGGCDIDNFRFVREYVNVCKRDGKTIFSADYLKKQGEGGGRIQHPLPCFQKYII